MSGNVSGVSENNDSFSHKAWEYTKSRFDKDNWFGSLAILAFIYRSYTALMAGRTREVNGKIEPDKSRVYTNLLSLLVSVWSFFSKRGGEFPEGDTLQERLTDVVSHPNTSATQLEFLARVPIGLWAVVNNLEKGLKAYGIGLKKGETAYAPERVRLFTGVALATATVLSSYGHFRPHSDEDTFEQEKEAGKFSGFSGVIRRVWKYDKMLVLGSLLDVVMPGLQAVESWKKRAESGKEAGYIMRGAIIGILINAATSFYVFQRIVRSNFSPAQKAEKPEPVSERPQKGQMETAQNDNTPRTGHAQKLIALNLPAGSFAQRVSSSPGAAMARV